MGFCRGLDSPTIVVIFAFLFFDCFNYIHGESNGTQNDVTPINHDLYHIWEALLEEIESLVHRHPDRLSMEKISTKNLGYEAQLLIEGTKKDCDSRDKLRILLTFGQHARELITTELALRLLSILSEEQFLPDVNRSIFYDSLDRLVIKIVPVENFNGRKVVEDGQLCERRNGRGVDLSRNWSVDWGKRERIMIQMKRILAPLHSVSQRLKLCANCWHHLNHIFGSMYTQGWRKGFKNSSPEVQQNLACLCTC